MLDIRESESYRAGRRASRAIADLGGARTNLVVPLLKDNESVGCIQIYRQEVRVFTLQQISLLEGFAAQAVPGDDEFPEAEAVKIWMRLIEEIDDRAAADEVFAGAITSGNLVGICDLCDLRFE